MMPLTSNHIVQFHPYFPIIYPILAIRRGIELSKFGSNIASSLSKILGKRRETGRSSAGQQ
jgi:hypothetical protein